MEKPMLLDKKWWDEFWKSPEGQELKAMGKLEEQDAEVILHKVRRRYWLNKIPDEILKAFEED